MKNKVNMERKIGEIFEFGGEWYQCVGGTCRNCSFYYDTVCKNITTRKYQFWKLPLFFKNRP